MEGIHTVSKNCVTLKCGLAMHVLPKSLRIELLFFFLKVLFTKVSHHNATVRQDTLQGLRDIFQSHPDLLPKHLPKLVEHVFVTLVDGSGAVRQASHLLMETLLSSSISRDVVSPFFETLIAHLNCGLTHIKEKIQLDSLKVLELYLKYCPGLLVAHIGRLHCVLLGLLSRQKSVSAYSGAVSKNKKGRSVIGILGQGEVGRASLLDRPASSLLSKGTRLRVLKLISGLLELTLEATTLGSYFPLSSSPMSFVEVSGALVRILVESWVESRPDDVLQGKYSPVLIETVSTMETVITMLCVLLKLLLRLTQDSEEKLDRESMMVNCCKKIAGDISSHVVCHFPFGVANCSVEKHLQHFQTMNFTFCEIALLLWKLSAQVKGEITDKLTVVVMRYLSSLTSSDITAVQNPTCSKIVANIALCVYSFSLTCSEAEGVLVGGVFRFIREFYLACHPHSRNKQLLVKCFCAIFLEELERCDCK